MLSQQSQQCEWLLALAASCQRVDDIYCKTVFHAIVFVYVVLSCVCGNLSLHTLNRYNMLQIWMVWMHYYIHIYIYNANFKWFTHLAILLLNSWSHATSNPSFDMYRGWGTKPKTHWQRSAWHPNLVCAAVTIESKYTCVGLWGRWLLWDDFVNAKQPSHSKIIELAAVIA